MSGLKEELHRKLRTARSNVELRFDGLSEHDVRRPMTSTGTNLLGLVKHLTGVEYEYLGTAFSRPPVLALPWVADGTIWQGADMWAATDESGSELLDGYLGARLVRMVAETAQHAGHADIVRELIDGTGGAGHDELAAADRQAYVAKVQAAADAYR